MVNNLTPVQQMFLVLFLVGIVCLVVVAVAAVAIVRLVKSFLETNLAVLRGVAAINMDTRYKQDKAERAVEEVKAVTAKTAEEVKTKVEQVRRAVSPTPWKEGDPDPRGKNLGPQGRGRGPAPSGGGTASAGGWMLGPAMILIALGGTAVAITADPDPSPKPQVLSMTNDDRLVKAAGLMTSRRYDDAADLFLRAMESGCDPEVCLARRAECLFYLGDNSQTLAEAERLEQHLPTSPWPPYLRGLIAKRTGSPAQAREHFHRAALLGHPQAPGQLKRVTRG